MNKIVVMIAFVTIAFGIKAQTIWTDETKFKGKIGDYEIMMTLAVPYGGGSTCMIIGEYSYTSTKREISLCSEDEERIIETTNGKETGYFIIGDWNKSIGQTVMGTWYSMDGKKSYSVQLTVVGKGEY